MCSCGAKWENNSRASGILPQSCCVQSTVVERGETPHPRGSLFEGPDAAVCKAGQRCCKSHLIIVPPWGCAMAKRRVNRRCLAVSPTPVSLVHYVSTRPALATVQSISRGRKRQTIPLSFHDHEDNSPVQHTECSASSIASLLPTSPEIITNTRNQVTVKAPQYVHHGSYHGDAEVQPAADSLRRK